MSLSESVQAVAQELYGVSRQAADFEDIALCAVPEFLQNELPAILEALQLPPPLILQENDTDAPNFMVQSKDFVLFAGVQQCIDRILSEQEANGYSQSPNGTDQPHAETEGFTDSQNAELREASHQFNLLRFLPGHLFACLDYVLGELAPAHETIKRQFFLVLETIGDQLLRINAAWVAAFWLYLETRTGLLKKHVFSSANTANRIAVLGFCNHLTDCYYARNSQGKYDSYLKDSFSDKFHARVRVFLANLLDFEDLTGLNKYFAIAQRERRLPKFAETGAKTGDDQLLNDILQFQKVLRNPYFFLKNAGDLAVHVDSMSKLNSYLLVEEAKYARVHPIRDIYKVKAQSLEGPGLRWFFPESYWTSAFEALGCDVLGETDPSLLDKRFGLANLDSSKYRKLVLVQIFLVCNFFIGLSVTKKKDLLARIGGKAATKHITEDYVPETIAVKLSKVKSDTLKLVRGWDPQLHNFLLAVSQSEENWLGWLLYGKNRDGNGPLLVSSKNISSSELSNTRQQYDSVYKFKTKRYFNTHVTPQLSRRMRTETGLEGLLVLELSNDYGERLEELTRKIAEEEDAVIKAQLKEEKVILVWKSVKGLRNRNWLGLNDALNMEDFSDDEREKPEQKGEAKLESLVTRGPEKEEIGNDIHTDSKEIPPMSVDTKLPETNETHSKQSDTEQQQQGSDPEIKQSGVGALAREESGNLGLETAHTEGQGEVGKQVAERQNLDAATETHNGKLSGANTVPMSHTDGEAKSDSAESKTLKRRGLGLDFEPNKTPKTNPTPEGTPSESPKISAADPKD